MIFLKILEENIDIKNWDRREQYQLFTGDEESPFFSITTKLDVTNYYKYIKRNNYSFYASLIYLVYAEMKKIKNFRYRIKNKKVVLLSDMIPAFAFLSKDAEFFKIGMINDFNDIKTFNDSYTEVVKNQQTFFPENNVDGNHFIQFSSLPWIHYSSLEMETNLNFDDAVPRVTWGKYEEVNYKITIPFTIQVNHKFIDGIHLGMFFDNLAKKIQLL